MSNNERAQRANEFFLKFASNTTERIAKGLRSRAEMAAQIARGELATGYRADWLRNASAALIDVLLEASEEFNAEHTDDMISVHDLVDALATAQNQLTSRAGQEPAQRSSAG